MFEILEATGDNVVAVRVGHRPPTRYWDFYEALDDEVAELLDDATGRAEANDRKTVQPRDL